MCLHLSTKWDGSKGSVREREKEREGALFHEMQAVHLSSGNQQAIQARENGFDNGKEGMQSNVGEGVMQVRMGGMDGEWRGGQNDAWCQAKSESLRNSFNWASSHMDIS